MEKVSEREKIMNSKPLAWLVREQGAQVHIWRSLSSEKEPSRSGIEHITWYEDYEYLTREEGTQVENVLLMNTLDDLLIVVGRTEEGMLKVVGL